MKNYIVRNCPSFGSVVFKGNCYDKGIDCIERDNCLLKRIVATCKQEINMNDKDAPTNAYAMGRVVVAEKILELLEIEEVDDTN